MTRIFITFLLMIFGASCDAQNSNPMPEKPTNPLICDPEKGLCEMPGHTHASAAEQNLHETSRAVRMVYFTDPICSACWSIEPQLRKLMMEYGSQIEVDYHMGGLLPSWDGFNGGGISKPSDVAHHWEDMSKHFDMPIDGGVWIEDPLASSYPPCIAYMAAAIQDKQKAAGFLRRLKEMVFLEKKNIAKWEQIQKAASDCLLDTILLRNDFNGRAIQLFQNDLALAQQYGVRGFPAIYFTDNNNNRLSVYGYAPYADFEQTLKKLVPGIIKTAIDTKPESLFARYSTYTTKEYSMVTGLTKEAAEKTLTGLVEKGMIEKYQSKNGALWKLKKSAK